MSRRGSDFAGLSVALVTPFTDGKLDVAKLKEQIEFQIDAGTTCLVPVGTTGESPTLSHTEQERLISETIQIAAGRIKVMAGTGSNSTSKAISMTEWAAKEGADATLQVAPYSTSPRKKVSTNTTKQLPKRSRFQSACTTSQAALEKTSNQRRLLGLPNSPASPWSKKLPARSTKLHRYCQ